MLRSLRAQARMHAQKASAWSVWGGGEVRVRGSTGPPGGPEGAFTVTISLPGGGSAAGDPTVLKMLLGAQLRLTSEGGRQHVSRDDAGYHIRASGSEDCQHAGDWAGCRSRSGDVSDLLDLYAVDAQTKDKLVQLAAEANQPPWWQRYKEVVSPTGSRSMSAWRRRPR